RRNRFHGYAPIFLLAHRGPRRGILRTENFTPDCLASLIKSQLKAGFGRSSRVDAHKTLYEAGNQVRGAPRTLAMVDAVMVARSDAFCAASRYLARSSIRILISANRFSSSSASASSCR